MGPLFRPTPGFGACLSQPRGRRRDQHARCPMRQASPPPRWRRAGGSRLCVTSLSLSPSRPLVLKNPCTTGAPCVLGEHVNVSHQTRRQPANFNRTANFSSRVGGGASGATSRPIALSNGRARFLYPSAWVRCPCTTTVHVPAPLHRNFKSRPPDDERT